MFRSEKTLIRIQSGLIVGTLILLVSATTWITQHELAGSMHMVVSEMSGHGAPAATSHIYTFFAQQNQLQRGRVVAVARSESDYSD